jgi:hypothetical protein
MFLIGLYFLAVKNAFSEPEISACVELSWTEFFSAFSSKLSTETKLFRFGLLLELL